MAEDDAEAQNTLNMPKRGMARKRYPTAQVSLRLLTPYDN